MTRVFHGSAAQPIGAPGRPKLVLNPSEKERTGLSVCRTSCCRGGFKVPDLRRLRLTGARSQSRAGVVSALAGTQINFL